MRKAIGPPPATSSTPCRPKSTSGSYSPERKRAIAELFVAGWGGYPLIGTKEQIVDGLATLSRMGLDGVLLSWPRFEAGMREFRDVTLPLVKQAGLARPTIVRARAPFRRICCQAANQLILRAEMPVRLIAG